METAKKKPAVAKKRVTRTVKVKVPAVRSLIGSVAKWGLHEKIQVAEEGISKAEFEEIKAETGLDYETLAHILTVTKATLHNKKGNEKFNAVVSERLVLLADIYAYGIEVFGEKERLNRWLVSEIRALGFKRPIDRLNTTMGMQEVKQIMGRIAHGIVS